MPMDENLSAPTERDRAQRLFQKVDPKSLICFVVVFGFLFIVVHVQLIIFLA